MANENVARGKGWRVAGWGTAAGLIMLPLVAMQFTSALAWTAYDFVLVVMVVGLIGIGIELAARMRSRASAIGAGIALILSFLLFLIAGAVGIIGSEDEVSNLLFLGVPTVALAGSAVARFQPAGMAKAMIAAAVAQVAVPGIAAVIRDSAIQAIWAPEVMVLTIVFTALWLVSARLFSVAARGA